jgi:hypothetical protein
MGQPREYCCFEEQKRLECKTELHLRRVQGLYFNRQLSFATAAPVAVQCVPYISTINEPAVSGNRHLSGENGADKMAVIVSLGQKF